MGPPKKFRERWDRPLEMAALMITVETCHSSHYNAKFDRYWSNSTSQGTANPSKKKTWPIMSHLWRPFKVIKSVRLIGHVWSP